MSSRFVGAGALVCLACLVGCSFFVPENKTAVDRARELERKCAGMTDATLAAWLTPAAVDSVEPAYAFVPGGPNGREARLRGAQLHVRPGAGLSRESLTRDLECHQMRATLAPATAPAGDPFLLPDRWLSIDVDSVGDGFVVVVHTNDSGDAQRVLERARAFAGRTAQPPPPASTGVGQPAPLQ